MSKIYIASKPVVLGAQTPGHLYLVYDPDDDPYNNNEKIIRGGPSEDQPTLTWGHILIENSLSIEFSEDALDSRRPGERDVYTPDLDPFADRNYTELDLDGRTAEEVWTDMTTYAQGLSAVQIDYDLANSLPAYQQNSNSVVTSTLSVVGIDISAGNTPIEGGDTGTGSLISQTGFPGYATYMSGSTSDTLYGWGGSDKFLDLGGGSDTFYGGNANTKTFNLSDGLDWFTYENQFSIPLNTVRILTNSNSEAWLEVDDPNQAGAVDTLYSIEQVHGRGFSLNNQGDFNNLNAAVEIRDLGVADLSGLNANVGGFLTTAVSIETNGIIPITLGNYGSFTGTQHGDSFAIREFLGRTFDGNSGKDTIDYSMIENTAEDGVTVSLDTQVAYLVGSNIVSGAGAGGPYDTIINIENVTGTQYTDILGGNAVSNTLSGGLGNDILTGGSNSTFVIDDTNSQLGEFIDFTASNFNPLDMNTYHGDAINYRYLDGSGFIRANLNDTEETISNPFLAGLSFTIQGKRVEEYAEDVYFDDTIPPIYTDTLDGIENIYDSTGNDLIIGNDESNIFHYTGGIDTYEGRDGIDYFKVDVPKKDVYVPGDLELRGHLVIDGGDGNDYLQLQGLEDDYASFYQSQSGYYFYHHLQTGAITAVKDVETIFYGGEDVTLDEQGNVFVNAGIYSSGSSGGEGSQGVSGAENYTPQTPDLEDIKPQGGPTPTEVYVDPETSQTVVRDHSGQDAYDVLPGTPTIWVSGGSVSSVLGGGSGGGTAPHLPSVLGGIIDAGSSLGLEGLRFIGRKLLELGEYLWNAILEMAETDDKASPLVLDLDGDGVELIALENSSVIWDIDEDDFAEHTGWTAGDDGFLAIDNNADGVITYHTELFGSASQDGFSALSALDTNADNIIDVNDVQFGDLLVWKDTNENGISEDGELSTLSELNITSIDLNASMPSDLFIEGHHISHVSSFTIDDGVNPQETNEIVDAWFEYDDVNSVYVGNYDVDIRSLFIANLRGYSNIPDLYIASSIDNDSSDPDSLMSMLTKIDTMNFQEIFAADGSIDFDVKDILFKWAGVDDINSSLLRGAMNAQELAFLEALSGQPFLQRGYNPNPLSDAAMELKETFETVFNNLFARILAQTNAGKLFTGDVTYNVEVDAIEGITGLDHAYVDILETEAANATNTLAFWQDVLRMVEFSEGTSNLSQADITYLNDAIVATDATLDINAVLDTLGFEQSVGVNLSADNTGQTLTGTADDDTIDGGTGNDTLIGLEGNDTISGSDGEDILNGGLGSDFLIGGKGDDTYVFEVGEAVDTIQESDGRIGSDTILFGAGITQADLTFTRGSNSDLLIEIDPAAGGGLIVVENQFNNDFQENADGHIEFIEFDDGSILDMSTIDYTLTGTENSSTIEYFYGVSNGGGENDTLIGAGGRDFLYGYDGDDVLDGGNDNDKLYGHEGNDHLIGGSGDDFLSSIGGTNIFDMGSGDDDIFGGVGNDTYIYTSGDDFIAIEYGGEENIVLPAGITQGDVIIGKDASSLFLEIGDLGTIKSLNHYNTASGVIEKLTFADQSEILLEEQDLVQYGTENQDFLTGGTHGYSGNGVYYGYGGDDYLIGSTGVDVFTGGEGNDNIQGGGGIDTAVFLGNYADFTITPWGGSSIYTTVVDNVGNEGTDSLSFDVEQIEFADGLFDIATETFTSYAPESPEAINIASTGFNSYSGNQDAGGVASLIYSATGAALDGNAWKKIVVPMEYTVTNDTYITFEYKSTIEGEIQGFGLDTDDDYDTGPSPFQIHGTDSPSSFIDDYEYTGAGDWQYFSINVGAHQTGAIDYLTFINDHDAQPQNGNGYYRNVVLYERDPGTINVAPQAVIDEFEGAIDTNIVGNLFDDNFHGLDFDVDNDALNAVAETIVTTNGSVTILSNGDFTYTPDTGFSGTDSFIYALEDSNGASDTTTATLFVGTTDADETFTTSGIYEHYNGGAGIDLVDYSTSATRVKLNLGAGIGWDGDANDDTYVHVENVIGTDIAGDRDFIYGSESNNYIWGLAGNDQLEGMGGADTIDGGAGSDYANYGRSDAGVTVNLKTNIHTGGDAEGDNLISIENITGSDYGDNITGSDVGNKIYANDGDDIIYGGAGTDTLYGENGADTFLYGASDSFGYVDTIKDFDVTEGDKIDISDLLIGYDPLTDAINDFVSFTSTGVNDAHGAMLVDADGGGDNYVLISYLTDQPNLDADTLETSGNLITI